MSAHFETFQRIDGAFGWRLVAGNGERIAASEAYTRRADAERGARDLIAAVLEMAEEAGTMAAIGIEEL